MISVQQTGSFKCISPHVRSMHQYAWKCYSIKIIPYIQSPRLHDEFYNVTQSLRETHNQLIIHRYK